MTNHTAALWRLTEALYPLAEMAYLRGLVDPANVGGLIDFDRRTPGPHMALFESDRSPYAIEDREVFRPLQYCAQFLRADATMRAWTARETIHMAGLHLEVLVKRVGRLGPLPLGAGLRTGRVRRVVGAALCEQIAAFAHVYNAAKHDVNQPPNTHLFSIEDAVLAYCVSRRLAVPLYPHARLRTDLVCFDAAKGAIA